MTRDEFMLEALIATPDEPDHAASWVEWLSRPADSLADEYLQRRLDFLRERKVALLAGKVSPSANRILDYRVLTRYVYTSPWTVVKGARAQA